MSNAKKSTQPHSRHIPHVWAIRCCILDGVGIPFQSAEKGGLPRKHAAMYATTAIAVQYRHVRLCRNR